MTLADLNIGQKGHVELHKNLRARLLDVREAGSIQLAIDNAKATGRGSVHVPDGVYPLVQTIRCAPGVNLELAHGAILQPMQDIDVVKLAPQAGISGGLIDCSRVAFTHAAILLDGATPYYLSAHTLIEDVRLIGGETGTGIRFQSIQQADFYPYIFGVIVNNFSVSNFEYGLRFEVTELAGSTQYASINANQFSNGYFFGAYQGGASRWSSADLITWTDRVQVLAGGGVGAWDELINVVNAFQKPDNSWVMFYRGSTTGGVLKIGLATSADGTTFTRKDNGGVNDGLVTWFGNNYDPTCVMLVGLTYYFYTNGDPGHGWTNVYTSTDLATWTPYAFNPIFQNGFCPTVWKYGDDYYMLICRDVGANGSALHEHGIALYRCANPIFDRDDREYLGYVVVNDQTYDDRYLDTPSVPVTDVNRDTYPAEFGTTLNMLYSGDLTAIKQNLAYSTLAELAARDAIPETATEL